VAKHKHEIWPLEGAKMNKDLSVTKLMPRWLAGWGLAGTAVTIVASCLFLFRNVDLITAV